MSLVVLDRPHGPAVIHAMEMRAIDGCCYPEVGEDEDGEQPEDGRRGG